MEGKRDKSVREEKHLVCAACAKRLGRYAWPGVPELVLGYCPQCGGTEAMIPEAGFLRAERTFDALEFLGGASRMNMQAVSAARAN